MSRQYMTQQDWEEVDRSSRTLIKKFLEAIGATEIQDSVGNCSYDIKCKFGYTIDGVIHIIVVEEK